MGDHSPAGLTVGHAKGRRLPMMGLVSLLALLFVGWFVWTYVMNATTHLEPS